MSTPRILVVDDEPDVADVVSVVLQGVGFEVVTVHSGQAALDELAARSFDLIVCDLVMPEVDGAAVHRAVQQRPEPRPTVLFLTGYHDARGGEAFLRQTGAPTLAKPFEIAALRETVKRLLQAR